MIYDMKRVFCIAAALLLMLASSCKREQTPTGRTSKELADPELSISGVPSGAMTSGSSFKLEVSSKSDGAIKVVSSQPAMVSATPEGEKAFTVSAVSSKDVQVVLTVSQEETEDYKAAVKTASFKVTGSGAALPGPEDEVEGTKVTFEEQEGEVVSPERGMYSAVEITSKSVPLSGADVRAKLRTGNSLWLLEFYLTDFITGKISNSYLKMIQTYFDAIREGGAKAIVRFAYRNTDANWKELDQEPEVKLVMTHVSQIKPYLQKNEDVLFALQAGFIGSWGEWYYTTHFKYDPKTAEQFEPRKELTDALLDAVPASRQIQLRTPRYKMMMYGFALKDTITAATAHDGSLKSRLAGHNDCFGADEDDRGTFENDNTRKYWKTETRYAIMGGETCAVSDFCLCPATLKDLQDYHWTYLHDGYNGDVLSRWKNDGCFDEIRTRMGYRLVLQDVHYGAIEAGKPCKVTIRLNNDGFAAPMNPREAWLVWVGSDGKTVKSLLGTDPRTWHSGYNAVESSFTPSTAKGTLYLELSDPLLSDNPLYSMVLANKDVFDAKTGYNKLFEVK